jgi:hypothetical protein
VNICKLKKSSVHSSEAAPLPKKAMTLDAPMAKEKQLEAINKQQMNEMMQSIEIIY